MAEKETKESKESKSNNAKTNPKLSVGMIIGILAGIIIVLIIVVVLVLPRALAPTTTVATSTSTSVSSTIASSSSTTVLPSNNNVTYTQITVTNSQQYPTPAPFQQLIQFNPSNFAQYEASDLGNIRFYYNKTELYSWCESGCTKSSQNATFWIKIPNVIGAGNSIVLNMTFESPSVNYDGTYAGEAPQLSGSYGQYDNGAKVFNFYDNFIGSSLNTSLWVNNSFASENPIIVNDGLTIGKAAFDNTYAAIYSKENFSEGIVEFDTVISTGAGTFHDQKVGFITSNDVNCGLLAIGTFSGPTNGFQGINNNCDNPDDDPGLKFGKSYIYSIIVPSSSPTYVYGMVNYTDEITIGSGSVPKLPKPIGFVNQANATGDLGPTYWIRQRAYPPVGVMPSVQFSS